MSLGLLDSELKERLERTCKSYLKHAVEHIVLQNDDYDNLLQVIINIQGALETVIKLFIVNTKGYKEIAILKKKQETYSEKQLLNDLNNGCLKFCNYEELINKVNLNPNKESCIYDINFGDSFFEFDKDIKTIIKEFELQRNQLIHIGLQSIKTENLYNALLLIIEIFTHFYYEANNCCGAFNYLESILGEELFYKFSKVPGVKEYVEKRSKDKYEGFMKYCFGCGFYTMYETLTDSYKCLFCGCELSKEFIFNEPCPNCKKHEIVYDSLNIEYNPYVDGRCSYCKRIIKIFRCKKSNRYNHKSIYYGSIVKNTK